MPSTSDRSEASAEDLSRIRLLALDVDGTLAARGSEVTPATRDALHRAAASGIEVVIATGRRYRSTKRIIDALDLPVCAVVLGGALVKHRDGATLAAARFDDRHFRYVLGIARSTGNAIICQRDAPPAGGGDFVVDAGVVWNDGTTAYFEQNREWALRSEDFAERGCEGALVVGAMGPEDQLRALDAEVHSAHPEVFRTSLLPANLGNNWYLEVAPGGVSKWTGLCTLADDLGIEHETICAVGDETNDLPMIRGAGVGVAMANGRAEVRAAADWVTGRCDEEGVAQVVERILGAK